MVVHGVGHEPPYVERARENLSEKRAIAQLASTFVHEGEVVVLDVGSTTFELAKLIRDRRNLTVFTASLPIAEVLAQSNVSVILVGGVLRKRELSLAGTMAIQIISQFNFDKLFLGTAGITVKSGFTDFGMDDVEVKKAFLSRSKQVIALAVMASWRPSLLAPRSPRWRAPRHCSTPPSTACVGSCPWTASRRCGR